MAGTDTKRQSTTTAKRRTATGSQAPRPRKPAQPIAEVEVENPAKAAGLRPHFRALLPLNVGPGQRQIGELVPEAFRWDAATVKALLSTERLVAVMVDPETEDLEPEIHAWIDQDHPELGTVEDPVAVAAYEQMLEDIAAGREPELLDPAALVASIAPPANTAEAVARSQARRARFVDADEQASLAERARLAAAGAGY